MLLLLAAAEQRPRPAALAHPPAAADQDRDLDRADLPPAPATRRARPIHPHRVRGNHDPNRHPGGLTGPVTSACSRPNRSWESVCGTDLTRPASAAPPPRGLSLAPPLFL